ncbi:hypothetical protein BJ742DRAFT_785162 [Cladochytrium replicatum]|nr:hypothetical protein BJ742DRAFT_785162 [Cladochytrium replicatum]
MILKEVLLAGPAVLILSTSGDVLFEILLRQVQRMAVCDRFRDQEARPDACLSLGPATTDCLYITGCILISRHVSHQSQRILFQVPQTMRNTISGSIPSMSMTSKRV